MDIKHLAYALSIMDNTQLEGVYNTALEISGVLIEHVAIFFWVYLPRWNQSVFSNPKKWYFIIS